MGGLFQGLTGFHLIIVVAVVLVLFGASKLPIFAKGLGQSIKIFRKEINDVKDDMKDERRDAGKAETEREVVYTNEPPAGTQTRRSPDER
ncbi:Sec-independent protein translocase subunit TatA/TatB [Amnibacterium endophyticum]|uniref:Sec-independent protein translocase protein TatA n=1 Tax=Amnibacterium endophyticum TaxID=2109337 RepID=A0ABW4LHG0_9MICO